MHGLLIELTKCLAALFATAWSKDSERRRKFREIASKVIRDLQLTDDEVAFLQTELPPDVRAAFWAAVKQYPDKNELLTATQNIY